ncbi:hypothetical protein BIW11_06231 [Tropilaelaps mercedesae]|uniref:Uncharacterized protein n=1 Tax=Tropilaelaps mercedesae TaxID=418985 RepID=A0A1V9XYX8_9ACAR|nr:hypothetical protein BIW11_06231 [Tropilaelaps mercedesae]
MYSDRWSAIVSIIVICDCFSVCPAYGDCPKCGLRPEDLQQLVCSAKSAFVVATGIEKDGKSWMSPRRWKDILGAEGHRYAVHTYPIDERQWELKDGRCRNYFVKPVYEITHGQTPRQISAPSVAGLYINEECRCPDLIRGAGYAVIAFKDKKVRHLDELSQTGIDENVIVAPLPNGDWTIPSCGQDFDTSGFKETKLPAAFPINDDVKDKCPDIRTCPKCEVVHSTEQLEGICTSQQALLIKRIMDNRTPSDQAAPWNIPKISVYVTSDDETKGYHQLRFEILPREENSCVRGKLRILDVFTNDFSDKRNQNFQLGEGCECDYLRNHTGYAILQSEREISEEGVLSEKEKILMIPEGQYIIPQCQEQQAEERSGGNEEDEEEAKCDEPEQTCPVCNEPTREAQEAAETEGSFILKMQTSRHLKQSEENEDADCGSAHLISVLKGDKQQVEPELRFTLPERCSCNALSVYGRQFYAVIRKDAFDGNRLENLPLNEKVYILGYNYRSYGLLHSWMRPKDKSQEDEAEKRADYDGYNSIAPQNHAASPPSYGPALSSPSASQTYAASQQGGYSQFMSQKGGYGVPRHTAYGGPQQSGYRQLIPQQSGDGGSQQNGYDQSMSQGRSEGSQQGGYRSSQQGGYGGSQQNGSQQGYALVSYKPLYARKDSHIQSPLQYSNYGMYVPIVYEPTYAPPTSSRSQDYFAPAPPKNQDSYTAAPQQANYGGSQQGGYDTPIPQQSGYGGPQESGYGGGSGQSMPQKSGYGSPQENGYGQPMPQGYGESESYSASTPDASSSYAPSLSPSLQQPPSYLPPPHQHMSLYSPTPPQQIPSYGSLPPPSPPPSLQQSSSYPPPPLLPPPQQTSLYSSFQQAPSYPPSPLQQPSLPPQQPISYSPPPQQPSSYSSRPQQSPSYPLPPSPSPQTSPPFSLSPSPPLMEHSPSYPPSTQEPLSYPLPLLPLQQPSSYTLPPPPPPSQQPLPYSPSPPLAYTFSSAPLQQPPSYAPSPPQQPPSYSPSPPQQPPSYSPSPPQQPPSYSPRPPPQQPPSYSSPPPQQFPSYSPPPPQQPSSYSIPLPQHSSSYLPPPPQQPSSFSPPPPQQTSSYIPPPQQPPSHSPPPSQQISSYSSPPPQQLPSYSTPPPQQLPSYSSPPPQQSSSYSSPPPQQSPSYPPPPPQQSTSYSSPPPQQSPSYAPPPPQQSPSYSSPPPPPPASPPSYSTPQQQEFYEPPAEDQRSYSASPQQPSSSFSASYSPPVTSSPTYSVPPQQSQFYTHSAAEQNSYPSPQQPSSSSYASPAAQLYGQSADDPGTSIAVSYSMPITIPIVSAKASSNSGYGKDQFGKTSGTHVVETKVEATYTTVVGLQASEQAPNDMPPYQTSSQNKYGQGQGGYDQFKQGQAYGQSQQSQNYGQSQG